MISDTFHSGLLWAAYLLCLLLSGVQSPYPATSVVTVSANVLNTDPTYVIYHFTFVKPPLKTTALSPFTLLYTCTAPYSSTGNVHVYSPDLSKYVVQSTMYNDYFAAVLKDSLILGASQSNFDARYMTWQLSVVGPDLASSVTFDSSHPTRCELSIDLEGSVYMACVSDFVGKAFKVNLNTNSKGSETNLPGVSHGAQMLLYVEPLDGILVGRFEIDLPILARVDFSTIKNPTWTGYAYHFLVFDGRPSPVASMKVAIFNEWTPYTMLRRFNLDPWTQEAEIDLDSYGYVNNILNFGPYQYVVTILSNINPGRFVAINKITWALPSISTFPMSPADKTVWFNCPHPGTLRNVGNDYIIILHHKPSQNFQSYYLTVADCTSRDASRVCQTCIAGYYRTDLNPDNQCLHPSDFFLNHGIDAANNAQAPCTADGAAAGCLSCLNDYTKCTTCDVGNSYYNLNGVCYLYAAIPDGYGIVTAGQQALAACTDTNCLKCVANKITCTRCKDSLGYYMRTSDSLCVHTSAIADGLGANLATYQYEACTVSNCQKCAANKNTCTQCLIASGYYWYVPTTQCVHTGSVADTYGANLVSNQYETCTDANCLKCAANKNTCTQCKISSGYYWYVPTLLCVHTGSVADTYGANTVTNQYETCTDPNCQKCAANKNTCTQCLIASGYYWYVPTTQCVHTGSVADTYGANTVSNQYETCTDPNCQKCAANKNTCTQCLIASGYYWYVPTTQCVHTGSVADTYGANTVSNQYETCTDVNCQKCAVNKNTCTQCKIASGYYWYVPTLLCIHTGSVADTYGANLVSNQYETCTNSNCQKCAANKNTCTQCLIASGYYWYVPTTQCVHTGSVADTYGANLVSNQYETCTDANCLKCAANKNTCTQCKIASGYYWYVPTLLCVHTGSVADTYGANLVSNQYETCTDPNCQKCAVNKNTCTQCKTGLSFYPNIGNNLCESVATATDTYGFNSGTNQFESCTDANCQKCAANKATCTQCKTGLGYYMNIGNNICENVATATDTYGFNSGTNQFTPCVDTNCKKCAANRNICTECKTASGFYMNIGTNLCENVATATDTYGFNSVSNQFESCTDANCLKCAANKNTCTQCKILSGYYWYVPTLLCVHTGSVADTYGANLVSNQYETCTDPNCQKCAVNKNTCTQCKTGLSFYPNIGNNLCESVATATDTYGFNSGTNQFESCTDANCQKCAANKATCTQCKTGLGYYKNIGNNLCQSVATVTDFYGFNSGTNQFESCSDVNCPKCAANYLICTECQTASGYYWYAPTTQCLHTSVVPDTYGVNTVTLLYESCADTNCKKCAVNKNTCTECKTASGYYMNIGTNLCENVATATDTYGFNSGSNQFESCTDANCLKCAANKNTCTQCKILSGYYWYVPTLLCVHTGSVADTYGANTVSNQYETCTDPNCQKCAVNKNTCTQCKTGLSFYPNIGNNLCESVATATDTYGFNSGTNQFESCTDANCQKCAANKATCTQCKTASGYYWYTPTSLCVHTSVVADTYGVNSATLQYQNCVDTNCQKCALNKSVCTQCQTVGSFYKNIGNNLCENVGTATDTYGFNSGTNLFEPCTDTNCQKCAANKNTCTQCKTGLSFYPNIGNNLCESVATATDTYGFNSGTNQFESCTDANCQKCAANKATCTQCKTGLGYYKNIGNNICENVATATDTYGFNSGTSQFEPCVDFNCEKCAANKNACTQCFIASNFFMNIGNSKCEDVPTATDTYGFNSITNQFESCADTQCQKCAADLNLCTQCKSGGGFTLDLSTHVCIKPNLNCSDPHCKNCSANYQICTECDQANGYILVNGSCAMPVMFVTTESKTKNDTVDLTFELTANKSVPASVLTTVEAAYAAEVNFTDTATNQVENVQFKQTLKKVTGGLTLTIKVEGNPKGNEYSVTSSSVNGLRVSDVSTIWYVTIQGGKAKFTVLLNAAEVKVVEQQAAPVAYTTSVSSGDSAASMSLMGTLMAADPTGTFFRFTKILQIVNKLYFININYGKRLEAFLAKSAPEQKADPEPSRPQRVYNRGTTRGKLSEHKVLLDFVFGADWKLYLFLASWSIKAFKRFLLDNCIMGKVGIYFCHYANKVHLIIFNLVFIDFIWLAPRTLMHSRGLPNYKVYTPAVILFLLAADLCLILAHLLDDRIWRKALEHYTNLRPYLKKGFVPPTETAIEQSLASEKLANESKDEQNRTIEEKNKSQTKQINYKRTYFEIDFNVHLMDILVTRLRMDESVYNHQLTRVNLLSLWLKVPMLQVLILGCQYCSPLAIGVLFFVTAIETYAIIYAYLKYKYLKNIICLLMEVSNPLSLSFFYLLAAFLSPKRFDEIILDFYQDAGIWIVIASCVAEYLLLLTYIGVAAYDFFKNRKMMKKMNLKSKYSLIHYWEGAEPQAPIAEGVPASRSRQYLVTTKTRAAPHSSVRSKPGPSSLSKTSRVGKPGPRVASPPRRAARRGENGSGDQSSGLSGSALPVDAAGLKSGSPLPLQTDSKLKKRRFMTGTHPSKPQKGRGAYYFV
jgi:hypothetical protein